MRTVVTVFTIVILGALAGCSSTSREKQLFSVDFQKGQALRYKFVSERDIDIAAKDKPQADSKTISKFSESMEMVVAYSPVEIDPYGLTTVKATCESVKIKRSSSKSRRASKRDAIETLQGKTFTFTVSAAGKINDYSQLEQLIKATAKKAFRSESKHGRVKEPDMVGDFIATQWFLWDTVSSIERAAEGVAVGQSWDSVLPVPNPMLLRQARNVTYRLDEIRQSERGRLAVIRSSYSPAESAPGSWPVPYAGRFQLAGSIFGMLSNYEVIGLHGEGEQLFNIDAGRTEQYKQNYQIQLKAFFPMGLVVNPRVTIRQSLTMQLLEN